MRRTGLNQVAGGDLGPTNASGDRRADDGPFKVQSRNFDSGLCGANRCIAFCLAAGSGIQLLTRDRLGVNELLRALDFHARQLVARASLCEHCFGSRHLGFVRPLVDHE